MTPHTINWFEIPAADVERAARFYSEVLKVTLEIEAFEGTRMAVFPPLSPADGPIVHGALVEAQGYVPSEAGTLVYLNGGDDLSEPLSRVEPAGGVVLEPKMRVGPHGYVAVFRDTEGNRVALHSAG